MEKYQLKISPRKNCCLDFIYKICKVVGLLSWSVIGKYVTSHIIYIHIHNTPVTIYISQYVVLVLMLIIVLKELCKYE